VVVVATLWAAGVIVDSFMASSRADGGSLVPMARHVLYCDVPVNRPTAQLLVARLSRLASECWQALTLVERCSGVRLTAVGRLLGPSKRHQVLLAGHLSEGWLLCRQ